MAGCWSQAVLTPRYPSIFLVDFEDQLVHLDGKSYSGVLNGITVNLEMGVQERTRLASPP